METRIYRGSEMTAIAGVNGSGKVISESSSVNKSMDAAEADNIVNDRLIYREPALHFCNRSIGQVLMQVRNEPTSVGSADIVPSIMKRLDLPVQMALHNSRLSLGIHSMESIFIQFPQKKNRIPNNS
jgi:hypothetical protein